MERHVRAAEKGVSLTGQGRKLVFSPDEMQDLKKCIVALLSLSFGMRIKDVAQLVESYVQHNNHEKGKKVLKFKGRPGYPGPDWLKSFMDKNSLSLKEATKLSRARYNATKNPFIIYNYFDLLEKTIHELRLQNRTELIWNCNESGLPHKPKNGK